MSAHAAASLSASLLARASRVLTLAREILREIFDESAYERFLARRGLASSPAAYAEFLQENDARRARRPRCC
jgi:hypothetical protein